MARNKYPEITVNRILDASLKLFMEKGYDHTTIQDIVEELGDLSKGAIYHHFKSKEDIIEEIMTRLYSSTYEEIRKVMQESNLKGLDKLHKIFLISLQSSAQELILATLPDVVKNPQILANQIYSSANELAPYYLQPMIEEGIRDGSIQGEDPKEMAEVLAILSNIWLNPSIFKYTKEEMYNRFIYLKKLFEKIGLPVFDDEIFQYCEKCRKILEKNNSQNYTIKRR